MFAQSMIAEFIDGELYGRESANDDIFERPKCFQDAIDSESKYCLFKGGRGSGKTFAVISHLIEESYKPEFKNCIFLVMRELIGNLDDIEETINDVIGQAECSEDFHVKSRKITNKKTGCAFVFRGARSNSGKTQMSQINKLKGIHNVRRVLIDEAQDMSEETLNVLLPTVNRSGKIKVKGKELKKAPPVRWFFCMNPNLKRDPAVAKVETQESHVIVHANIFDIEPQFQDEQLLEQARSEQGQFYYDHVWLGKEFYRISGYPFANTNVIRTNEEFKTYAFLDPSFAGGDYTALSFITEKNGLLYFWGTCWREAWNTVKHQIVEELKKHNAIEFVYESNALADTPQEVFGDLGINAIPRFSLGNKHNRIYRGASEIENRCALVSNKSNEAFIKNVLEYSEEASNDDAPDSLVSNLMAQGVINYKKVA